MTLGNTAVRIIVSVIAIPLIIIVCYLGGIPFFLFVTAIALLAFHEFAEFSLNKNASVNLIIGFPSIISILVADYLNWYYLKPIILVIVVALSLFELFRNKGSAILNIGTTLLGIFYIGLFAGTIIDIREFFRDEYIKGGYLIISILAAIWICDSAAFFIGSAIGKHKLFPRVSPKKSWEGAAAGFIFAILAFIAAKYIILDFISLMDAVALGIIVGIIGQAGDLVESLLKRDAGVKDSSVLIPGHGGIFDRFDSLFLTAPVVYLYFYILYL